MSKNEKTMISAAKLKLEFLRLLTEDSPHHDRRKKDFNQAIFDAEKGFAIFNGTDLEMVMEKFNRAVANLMRDHVFEVISAGNDNRKFYKEGYGSGYEGKS